jgi:hypothetical protein
MAAGRARISQSTLGAISDLVTGDFSCMPYYVYFYPEDGGDSICLDHDRQAFRCRRCEAFVLAGTSPSPERRQKRKRDGRKDRGETEAAEAGPRNCPACGAAIGPADARCPDCDIALE